MVTSPSIEILYHAKLTCKEYDQCGRFVCFIYCFSDSILVCPIRYSKFQSVASITLHFPDNFGGDTTQIYYIGLKGEATQVI